MIFENQNSVIKPLKKKRREIREKDLMKFSASFMQVCLKFVKNT
jgi:hypothetical protein